MKAAIRAVRRKSSFSADHPSAPVHGDDNQTMPPLPGSSSPYSSTSPQAPLPRGKTPQLSDPARVSAFGMDAILAMAAPSADPSLERLAEDEEEPLQPSQQPTSPLYEKVFGNAAVPASPSSQQNGSEHQRSRTSASGRPSTANSSHANSDYFGTASSLSHVHSFAHDQQPPTLAPASNDAAGGSDVSLSSNRSASMEYRSKFMEVESPEVQATRPAPAMSKEPKGRGRSSNRADQTGVGAEEGVSPGEQKGSEGKRRSFSLPRRSKSKTRTTTGTPSPTSNPPPVPLPIGAQVPPGRISTGTRASSTSPQPPPSPSPVAREGQHYQYQQQQQQQHIIQSAHQPQIQLQAQRPLSQQPPRQHTGTQGQRSHAPLVPPVEKSRRASAVPPAPAPVSSVEKEKSSGGLFGMMRNSSRKKSKENLPQAVVKPPMDEWKTRSLGPSTSSGRSKDRQSIIPPPHPVLNGRPEPNAHVSLDGRRGIATSGGSGPPPIPVAQSVSSVSNENEAAAARLRERLAVLAVKENERGAALVAKGQERQAAEAKERERIAALASKEEERVAALAAAKEAERAAAEAKEQERADRRARKAAAAAYEVELKQKARAAALAAEVERAAAARRGAEAQAKMREARKRGSIIHSDGAVLPNGHQSARPPPSQKRMSIVAGPQAQRSSHMPVQGMNTVDLSQASASKASHSSGQHAGDMSSAESNTGPVTPRDDDPSLTHQQRSWSNDESFKSAGLAQRSWSTRQTNGWSQEQTLAKSAASDGPTRAGLTDSPELDPMPEDDPDAVPGRPNSRFGLVIDASERASVDLNHEAARQGNSPSTPSHSPQSKTSELSSSHRDSRQVLPFSGPLPREYVQSVTRRTIPAPSQLMGLPRSPSARYTFEEVTYLVCVPKLRKLPRSKNKSKDGAAQHMLEWRTDERRVFMRYSDLFPCLFSLASEDLLEAIIAPLEGLEIKTLRQTCATVRRVLDGTQGRELVLRRFLSEHGYQIWRHAPQIKPGLPLSPIASGDPLPLTLADLDSFLLGQDLLAEYPLVAASSIQTPQDLDPRIPRLARASTRAYNRVVARLRLQPHFSLPPAPAANPASAPASPNMKRSPGNSPLLGVQKVQGQNGGRINSYYPSTPNGQHQGSPGQSPAASPSLTPHRLGPQPGGISPAVSTHSLAASSVSGSSMGAPASPAPPSAAPKVTPSLYRPGRAALFRVWVPSTDGLWLDDDEVAACEAEMYKAGVWKYLKPGDIVWDTAIGNMGNVGKMIFDGSYLRDLSYVHDPFGHLPSWVNAFHFSPSYFHNVIRSSTDQPTVFLDVLPWREAILTSLRLVQDRVDTPGRYRIARWVHRASFRIAPGQIVSAEGEGLEVVDEGWAGTIYIEADGTSEAAQELVLRCAGPDPSAQLRADLLARVAHTADPNPNPLGPLPPLRMTSAEGERKETTTPWAIIRERSRPGQIWIRPVTENRLTI